MSLLQSLRMVHLCILKQKFKILMWYFSSYSFSIFASTISIAWKNCLNIIIVWLAQPLENGSDRACKKLYMRCYLFINYITYINIERCTFECGAMYLMVPKILILDLCLFIDIFKNSNKNVKDDKKNIWFYKSFINYVNLKVKKQ